MTGSPDTWLRFAVAVLATWRVTHLLAREDGPADIVVRFRGRVGSGFAGQLMDCFTCMSLWIAAPFAFFVGTDLLDRVIAWLALSGAACLLERLAPEPATAAAPRPEGEVDHGMLRTEADGTAEHSGGRLVTGPRPAADG
jgi:hypothetical protein